MAKKMKTLIVTNDMGTSYLLVHWLRKFRSTAVAIVNSGRRALHLVEEETFGLVFLDLALPDIPGEELIPAFRTVQEEIPLITMTDNSCQELERRVRSYGIIFYMQKPVSVVILQELLRHHIKKHNLQ